MNKRNDNTLESPITRRKVRVGSWRGRLALMVCKVAFGVSFCCAVAHGFWYLWSRATEEAHALKDRAIEYITPAVLPKEPTDEELESLIARVSREKDVDPLILTVIAEKESTSGKWLYHFEPEKFQSISQKGSKYAKQSDDERRMLASSHGAFHVLGLSAGHFCQLHWSKMYQPLVGARCAASIVRVHMDATKDIKAPGHRIREVFRRYNGEGQRAEEYADDAMSKLAGLLYDGMSKKKKGA